MGIYITGDTHGWIDSGKLYKFNLELTSEDYLIIAGDAGFIWSHSKHEKEFRNELQKDLDYTILFVDGNHENFELLEQYKIVDFHNGKARRINDKMYHLMRGEIYEIEGNTYFTFGGAHSTDKENRTPFISWWPREVPNYMERDHGIEKLTQHNWEVDYIITHDMPHSSVLKLVVEECHWMFPNDSVKEFLDFILDKTEYKKWFCGHHHLDEEVPEDKIIATYNGLYKI